MKNETEKYLFYDFFIYKNKAEDALNKTIRAKSDADAIAEIEAGNYLNKLDRDNESCFAELIGTDPTARDCWKRIKAWDNAGNEKFIHPNKIYIFSVRTGEWRWEDTRWEYRNRNY